MPRSSRPSAPSARLALLLLATAGIALPAAAQHGDGFGRDYFSPGNIVISRSVYDNRASNVQVGQPLPPDCPPASGGCVTATNDGTYPTVFNNDLADGSFGVTSRIFLDQVTPGGWLINSLEVPSSDGDHDRDDHSFFGNLVTSFSSKSELALNLSTDGRYLTFMGYVAPVNALDVSNSNTPGIVDPTNPVGTSYYRAVARVDAYGQFTFTETSAYSGNNGRAAILNDSHGANFVYTAGNAGNGGNPQPDGIIIGAGTQFIRAEDKPEFAQKPGDPTPLGSFNVTQLGDAPDKIGKDTNFRGLTIADNVVYLTKGSGGNGVNTVYFVDTTGTVCSDSNGDGLPVAGAALPTAPLAYNPSVLQTQGLDPNNMCVLKGFPTKLKSKTSFPFGIWFANATTLYVADEGNGDTTYNGTIYSNTAAQTTAGLQKWVFNGTQWTLAYTLQNGLNLGVPYTVPGYPTGNNAATGLPWAPATAGLRNLTGKVNRDGSVTIYAVTATVSGSGDPGADPNKVVVITDSPSATTLPSTESFSEFRSARSGEVLRGVSFAPQDGDRDRF